MSDNAELLSEIRALRKQQDKILRELAYMRETLRDLVEIKVRTEYMPELVREKLAPLIGQLTTDKADFLDFAQAETQYIPQRKAAWSWKEHILFTLFEQNRPLQSSELVDIHHQLGVRGKKARRLVLKDVSKNLTALVQDGRVIKYKPSGSTKFFYCLPTWMDKKGQLRKSYHGRGPFL